MQPRGSPGIIRTRPLSLRGASSWGAPMVLKVGKKRKKRKKKYSRGLKGIQKSFFRASKGTYRLSSALSRGFKSWRQKSARSARRRRDGLFRDGFKNSAKAFGKVIRVTSKAPKDFVRAINPITLVKPHRVARFWGRFWPGR
jgi:hypothetical protein